MKTKFNGHNLICAEFSSLNELTNVCDARTIHSNYYDVDMRGLSDQQSASRTEWSGSESLAHASQIAKDGYREGYEQMKNVSGIQFDHTRNVGRIEFREYGFVPCVGRAVSGHPKAMMFKKKVAVKSPVIEIFYNSAIGWRYDADAIIRGGKNLLNTIEYIESKGYRVKLTCGFLFSDKPYDNKDYMTIFKVCVKQASNALNPLALAYPLVHPSFMRRHCFALMEHFANTAKNFQKRQYYRNGGYVAQYSMLENRKKAIEQNLLSKDTIYIDASALTQSSSINDVIALMQKQSSSLK